MLFRIISLTCPLQCTIYIPIYIRFKFFNKPFFIFVCITSLIFKMSCKVYYFYLLVLILPLVLIRLINYRVLLLMQHNQSSYTFSFYISMWCLIFSRFPIVLLSFYLAFFCFLSYLTFILSYLIFLLKVS